MSNPMETAKAEAVMNFVNTLIGAFDSGFVDSNQLNLKDLHSAAFHHVKDSYGYEADRIDKTFDKEVLIACGAEPSKASSSEVDLKPRMKSSAVLSDCEKYRYQLTRSWSDKPNKSFLNIIGLNPSTADASNDDPTITRCINFAKDWGYDGLIMTNLFAIRSKDPEYITECISNGVDPYGLKNNEWVYESINKSDLVLAAWGNGGSINNRGPEMLEFIKGFSSVYHLKLTKAGNPSHPLYLKKTLKPIRY